MHYIITVPVYILLFILISCDHSQRPSQGTSVFSIGQITISDIEFERYLDWKIHTTYNGEITSETILHAIQDVIDRIFFMAEAYDQGFHHTQETIDYYQRYRINSMVSEGKYLYNDVVTNNISITEQTLLDTYKKRNMKYNFSIIQFKDKESYHNNMNDGNSIHDVATFQKYISLFCKDTSVVCNTLTLQWPFTMFLDKQDIIYHMEPNSVAGPFHLPHGTFVIYLEGIDPIPQKPFEEQKGLLKLILTEDESVLLMTDYDMSIHRNAQSNIDIDAINDFFRIHWTGEQASFVDESLFQDIQDKSIASFNLRGERVPVSIASFIDYYNSLPMRSPLNSLDQCLKHLKEYIFSECAFADAQDRGLTNDPRYIAHCERHLHEFALAEFEKNYLEPLALPSSEEVEQHYQSKLDSFRDGETVIVSYFVSDNQAAAIKNGVEIQKLSYSSTVLEDEFYNTTRDSFFTQNTVFISRECELTHGATGVFSNDDVQNFFEMENDTTAFPLEIDHKFYVVYKHSETGTRTKPLKEVRDQIVATLQQQKLAELKAEMLPELKKKYTLIDNIDYDKYLSEEWIQSVLDEREAKTEGLLTP